MRFEGRYTFRPLPFEPNEFIVSHEIDIIGHTADDDGEVVVGRIGLDLLDIGRVEDSGRRVLDVCDADSGAWVHMFTSVMDPEKDFTEPQQDLGFDGPINEMVFVHRTAFHPVLREWQRMIMDQICTMFSCFSATVMWRDETDMSDQELASLGFRVVSGCDLVLRTNMLRHKYSAASDSRDKFDLEVPRDAAARVEELWAESGDAVRQGLDLDDVSDLDPGIDINSALGFDIDYDDDRDDEDIDIPF